MQKVIKIFGFFLQCHIKTDQSQFYPQGGTVAQLSTGRNWQRICRGFQTPMDPSLRSKDLIEYPTTDCIY